MLGSTMRGSWRTLLVLLAVVAVPAATLAQTGKVTLLQVNDVYEISPARGKGGLAELATLLKEERAQHANTITVIPGDFLSPSIMSALTKGAQMIELFNALQVDYVTFGNHEFDFGPDVAKQRIAESKFVWLGTNVLGADGKVFGGAVATATKQVGDVKPETHHLSSPGPDVKFVATIEAARAAVAQLKQDGAHVIIALTHLDLPDDRALAKAVPGIDVIVGGHEHEPISWYERTTLIHKAGTDAQYLGAIDLDIRTTESAGRKTTTVVPQWRMWANYNTKPDPDVALIVKKYTDKLDQELGVVIGKTTTELDSRTDSVRTVETRSGNLYSDAIMAGLGAEAAITNGGGMRANRVIAAGADLTRKDILQDLPFGNLSLLIELKGEDLKAALESGLSMVETKAGRFPQVAGLTVEYDPKAPPGSRVTKVTVAGQPLDPARIYKIATTDYMAGGGDGYAALAKGKVLTDPRAATLMATMVMEYIQAKGTVSPQLDGRILAKQ
jgi:5'-nucleotidase/UDP-sugar diphosphatase